MHQKRVTCELHDSYFCAITIKHAIPKTAEVTHSNGQLWGDIEWAIELSYNSVRQEVSQFGDRRVWRQDAVEKTAPGRSGPRDPRESLETRPVWRQDAVEKASTQRKAGPPVEQHQENEKETLMTIRVGINMLQFCSVSNSLSHTTFSNKVRGIFF